MMRLLHERLRDDANEWEDRNEWEEAQRLRGMADEIERYYIPRPRFGDGEPAKFGEELENGKRIANITYHIGGRCTINDTATWQGTCESDYELKNNETLKRPTHKVLDADGVEIKVSDTVYNVNSGNGGVVTGFDPCELIEVEAHDGGHWKNSGNNLTHEKPVFDAEGVRICKGDTVWDEDGSYVVTDLAPDKRLKVCTDGESGGGWVSAELLTHREPDSLERIENDATILPYAYCLEHGIGLSATPDMEEATIAMVNDLLRRQREVLRCDQSS